MASAIRSSLFLVSKPWDAGKGGPQLRVILFYAVVQIELYTLLGEGKDNFALPLFAFSERLTKLIQVLLELSSFPSRLVTDGERLVQVVYARPDPVGAYANLSTRMPDSAAKGLLQQLLMAGVAEGPCSKTRRIVSVPTHVNLGESGNEYLEALSIIQDTYTPDGVVLRHERKELAAQAGIEANVVQFDQYHVSPFERLRKDWKNEIPEGELTKEKLDSLLIRAMKYSKFIRLFDRIMGKQNVKNLAKWRSSIIYILRLFKEFGVYSDRVGIPIDIVTWTDREWGKDNLSKKQMLDDQIQKPISAEFPDFDVCVHLKARPTTDVHARHLQTSTIVVHFDHGLDLFRDPRRCRNVITQQITSGLKSLSTLQNYFESPDANLD